MKRRLAIWLVAALLAIPAAASEFLETEGPHYWVVFDENHGYLQEAYAPDVVLHMVVEPSFQLSYAVFLKKRDTGFSIVTLKLPPKVEYLLLRYRDIEALEKKLDGDKPYDQLDEDEKNSADYLARLKKDIPPYPKEVIAERCEMAIDTALADRLIQAWHVLLADTRAIAIEDGLDGTFYNFFMRFDGKRLAGYTWSPDRDTRPGRLVEIGEMMRQHCLSRRENILMETDLLLGKLASSATVLIEIGSRRPGMGQADVEIGFVRKSVDREKDRGNRTTPEMIILVRRAAAVWARPEPSDEQRFGAVDARLHGLASISQADGGQFVVRWVEEIQSCFERTVADHDVG